MEKKEWTLFKTRSHHRLGGRDNWTVREKGNLKPHANLHLVKEIIKVTNSEYVEALEQKLADYESVLNEFALGESQWMDGVECMHKAREILNKWQDK